MLNSSRDSKTMRPVNFDEAQLAEKFRNGDPASLDQLWKDNFKALVYFANQLVKNDQLSEDIVSETFIKLWRLHENFDNIHSIRSFLYVTIRNNCYDHLRSQEIHARIHKEILYNAEAATEISDTNDYDMMYAEYIQQLYLQLRELPDRCRLVFNMYFFDRRTTREIALALNISEQTVRNQKTKAIQILKSALLKKDMLPAVVIYMFALLCGIDE